MITSLFHANCVAIEDNDQSCLVGFADQEFDTRQYLQLQRSHTNDSQDRSLGLDTYYVERDDQSNSCYGGVERIELYADMIRLRFSAKGLRSLDLREAIRITFDVDEETLNALRSKLTIIFADTDCLRDRTGE